MIFAPFTLVDAGLILKESEGRPNRDGRGVGHTGARHGKLTNEQLMDRLRFEGRSGTMPIMTRFHSFEDQQQALFEILTDAAVAPKLNLLFRKHGSFSHTFARQKRFQIEVATGGGVVSRWDDLVHVAAEWQERAYRNLHIITMFPRFAEGTLGHAER